MTNLDLSRSLLCLLLSMFAVRTGFAFQAKPGRPTDIFAPRQQMQRWHSTTAIGTATFPTPDGSGLGMERLSQEFSCPFMPLRRPLVVRPESAPERGLWLFEQPHHVPPAFEIFVRMTVYALADGSIIVYNPIAPTEETLQEIQDAFGDPDHVVIPTNSYDHTLYVGGWAERFPRARFWGLEGVKLPGAHFTSTLSAETMPEEWLGELDLCVMEANPLLRECFMYHRSTKTVFAMDSLVYLQPEHVSNAFLGTVLTMAGMYGRPCCPIKPLLLNRRRCQEAVSKVLEWDFHKIYATHGACPIYDGQNVVAEAFQFLWD